MEYAPPPGYTPPPGYWPPPGYPPGGYPQPTYPPGGYPPPGAPGPYGAYGPYPYYRTVPTPGAETHDGGYLRMQLGFNSTTLSARSGGNTVEYGGGGASAAIAFGYSITPHFVPYIELLAAGAVDLDTRVNGTSPRSSSLGNNVFGVGPGAASYFGPNLFVAATLLVAYCEVTDSKGNTLVRSDNGLAFEALFGKEWWTSDNWGLGVSGQMIFGAMKGRDPDLMLETVPSWRTSQFSLLFSATYN